MITQHPIAIEDKTKPSPPIAEIDILKYKGFEQGELTDSIMANEEYSVPAQEAFGSNPIIWSDLDSPVAHGNGSSAPEAFTSALIDRNVNMIEFHIVNVMNWRQKKIENRLKRSIRKPVDLGHRHYISAAEQTDLSETTCSDMTSASDNLCSNGNEMPAPSKSPENLPKSQIPFPTLQNGVGIISLHPTAKSELIAFVKTVASRYNQVRYHNFEHASHVTACVHQLILMCQEGAATSVSRRPSEVTSSSSSTDNSSQFYSEDSVSKYPSIHNSMSSNPIMYLALLITALIHDVEHQGVGNKQLVNESDPLAIKYKGKSVAENNSFDVSNSLLYQDKFKTLRQCIFGETDTDAIDDQPPSAQMENFLELREEIRKEVEVSQSLFHQISHDVIMATDISCPMRMEKGKMKWSQAFEQAGSVYYSNCGTPTEPNDMKEFDIRGRRLSFPPMTKLRFPRRQSLPHKTAAPTEFIADPFPDQTKLPHPGRAFSWIKQLNFSGDTEIVCPLCHTSSSRNHAFKCRPYTRVSSILEQMMQAADVGHAMQSWPVFIKWNEKLYNELWVANIHSRGPDCLGKWFEGQISFFDNYIFPLAQRLRQCGVFGARGSLFYENATLNRNRWMIEGLELCREMHQNATRMFGTSKSVLKD